MLYSAAGELDAAEHAFEQALAIRRKVLGEQHSDTAACLINLSGLLQAIGDYAAAWPYAERALAIYLKVLGKEHPDTASAMNILGSLLHTMGSHAAALPHFEQALAIRRKVLGEEHPYTVLSYHNVAINLHAQGKYDRAEEFWVVAADRFNKVRLRIAASGLERAAKTAEQSPLPSLAAVLARNGKPEAAWQRFEESLARGTWDDLSARLRRPADEQAKQAQLAARLESLDHMVEKTITAGEPTPEQKKRLDEILTGKDKEKDKEKDK